MRWFFKMTCIAGALAAGGCASDLGPSAAEIRAHWEAENVYPENYKADLLAFLRTYLNDPTHLRDTGVSSPVRKNIGPGERYIVCVRFNARDNNHHYVGVKVGAATYVSGKLDRFFDPGKRSDALCADATFAPFPALAVLKR